MNLFSGKISEKTLVIFQLYYNIFVKFLVKDLGAPAFLNYITDLITIFLLLLLLRKRFLNIKFFSYLFAITVLFGLGSLVAGVNDISPILSMWAIRNHGRFFIWFIIAANMLELRNIDYLLDHLNKFMVFNFIFMIFQYVFLNQRDDCLNGFFGSYAGGNSALNTVAVILTIENISAVFTKRKSMRKAFFYLSILCGTCALNEIKFYFVEIILIVGILVFFIFRKHIEYKILKKCIGIFCSCLIIAIVGYQVLVVVYPGFKTFFNRDVLENYLTRSYNSSHILYVKYVPISNRLTAYGIIITYFLCNTRDMFLGLGWGAFEMSSFFQSALYKEYGAIAITGYLYPNVLVEAGILGLMIYIFIYISIFLKTKKIFNEVPEKRYYALIAGTTAVMGMVINIYNSALKIESSGYLFYTILAIALCKGMKKSDKKYN